MRMLFRYEVGGFLVRFAGRAAKWRHSPRRVVVWCHRHGADMQMTVVNRMKGA